MRPRPDLNLSAVLTRRKRCLRGDPEPPDERIYCERCERYVIPIDAQGDALCPRCGLVL